MTSTERTYTLELSGKELEMVSIALGIAMAAFLRDVESGAVGLTMARMRGAEGRDVFVNAAIKFYEAADAVPDNTWDTSGPFDDPLDAPLLPEEMGLEPPSPFPMARPEVC